jgi:hypothetical protein
MGNEIAVYQELEKKAIAVAKSGLFGVKTPDQAIALFLVAEAEGIPVMQAVLDYHIIDNKPALKSDAMLRRFQASGGIVKWVDRSDTKVSAYFSHPSCPDPILIDWDMDRAAKAGLSTRTQKDGKPNMWAKFPRQMLTARVISEGIRATAPGHAAGIYTPEEVADFEPSKPAVIAEKPAEQAQGSLKSEITDADVVVQKDAVKPPLSQKTLAKFEMAKSAIGADAFRKILNSRYVEAVCDIQDEEEATSILRLMREAFEAQKGDAV